jgi:hypothetical protein
MIKMPIPKLDLLDLRNDVGDNLEDPANQDGEKLFSDEHHLGATSSELPRGRSVEHTPEQLHDVLNSARGSAVGTLHWPTLDDDQREGVFSSIEGMDENNKKNALEGLSKARGSKNSSFATMDSEGQQRWAQLAEQLSEPQRAELFKGAFTGQRQENNLLALQEPAERTIRKNIEEMKDTKNQSLSSILMTDPKSRSLSSIY